MFWIGVPILLLALFVFGNWLIRALMIVLGVVGLLFMLASSPDTTKVTATDLEWRNPHWDNDRLIALVKNNSVHHVERIEVILRHVECARGTCETVYEKKDEVLVNIRPGETGRFASTYGLYGHASRGGVLEKHYEVVKIASR